MRTAVAAALLAGLVATAAAGPAADAQRADPTPVVTPAPAPAPALQRLVATAPLAGITIALDPGHQLGNHNFPRQIRRPVPAGGFSKPCNTTGTATNSGYAEATFTWQVSRLVAARLRALGAEVVLTRTANSESLWGPCVDYRGRFGARVRARLEVSLHGDGARSSGRGFHVIAPVARAPWTTDIAAPSYRLAKALRAGLDSRHLPRSTYLAGGTALVRRSDLATLNLSDVPVAMIELGNMRNASDARRMKSPTGRATYAAGVVAGIRKYLGR
ncbi:MAG: N-acetylmuramoyl-L-alanine amidase [Nocardioidaceae bacterium]|nr:N-acetylmuramoyl-L-alanine amidase [Nocardioidaceae bacterium]